MSAIEVLKEWKRKMAGKVNVAFTPEEFDALGEALKALQQIEAIKLWCNRDKVAKEKYTTINHILEEKFSPEQIKNHLKLSEGRLK